MIVDYSSRLFISGRASCRVRKERFLGRPRGWTPVHQTWANMEERKCYRDMLKWWFFSVFSSFHCFAVFWRCVWTLFGSKTITSWCSLKIVCSQLMVLFMAAMRHLQYCTQQVVFTYEMGLNDLRQTKLHIYVVKMKYIHFQFGRRLRTWLFYSLPNDGGGSCLRIVGLYHTRDPWWPRFLGKMAEFWFKAQTRASNITNSGSS